MPSGAEAPTVNVLCVAVAQPPPGENASGPSVAAGDLWSGFGQSVLVSQTGNGDKISRSLNQEIVIVRVNGVPIPRLRTAGLRRHQPGPDGRADPDMRRVIDAALAAEIRRDRLGRR